MVEYAKREGYHLDADKITCPVRIVWGTEDKLLPWPSAAVRYRTDWLPHADWVELDGVGHCPQLDVPLETAQLIVGLHGAVILRRRRRRDDHRARAARGHHPRRPAGADGDVVALRPG